MDFEKYAQPEYWKSLILSIYHWLLRDVLIADALLELIALLACFVLAGLIARPFKPKLRHLIERLRWELLPVGRFLGARRQVLTLAVAIVLLWFALAAFLKFKLSAQILNTAVSLLTIV